jgi:hypothetical protein
MSEPAKTATDRIRNWAESNSALVRRGSLSIWVEAQALRDWNYRGPAQGGGQDVYSDAALPGPAHAEGRLPPPAAGEPGDGPLGLRAEAAGPGGPPLQHPLPAGRRPQRGALPQVEGAAPAGAGRREAPRQIPPPGPGAEPPEDPLQAGPVVGAGPTALAAGPGLGQELGDLDPWLVAPQRLGDGHGSSSS